MSAGIRESRWLRKLTALLLLFVFGMFGQLQAQDKDIPDIFLPGGTSPAGGRGDGNNPSGSKGGVVLGDQSIETTSQEAPGSVIDVNLQGADGLAPYVYHVRLDGLNEDGSSLSLKRHENTSFALVQISLGPDAEANGAALMQAYEGDLDLTGLLKASFLENPEIQELSILQVEMDAAAQPVRKIIMHIQRVSDPGAEPAFLMDVSLQDE